MASMKVNHLKRREFITLLGGAATWPLRAQAQQPERMRRIGVLMSFDENDPTMKLRVSAFTQALADLGWTDGRNVRMDLRRRLHRSHFLLDASTLLELLLCLARSRARTLQKNRGGDAKSQKCPYLLH